MSRHIDPQAICQFLEMLEQRIPTCKSCRHALILNLGDDNEVKLSLQFGCPSKKFPMILFDQGDADKSIEELVDIIEEEVAKYVPPPS
jgi:hypothetical protein